MRLVGRVAGLQSSLSVPRRSLLMTSLLRNLQLMKVLDLRQYGDPNYCPNQDEGASPYKTLIKIMATVGPKTSSKEMLGRLLNAGMNVCRINACHGSRESHAAAIDNLREVLLTQPGRMCAILLDLSGEIRVGRLKSKKLQIDAGTEISIVADPMIEGDASCISLDYPNLVNVVKPGSSIIMSDGVSSMTVLSVHREPGRRVVRVRANTNLQLEEQRFVFVPGATLDLSGLQFAVEHIVDFIAAQVSNADEVRDLRKRLRDIGGEAAVANIKIIAKIGSIEALENIDAILAESDGMIVSRGDLGVVVPEEQVFALQKSLVSKANAVHKPAIIATQMLYSMIRNPRPTRAECTDVANAVIDGCDTVQLSGETENGDYPIEACEMMQHICRKADQVERLTDYTAIFEGLVSCQPRPPSVAEVVASYAVRLAHDMRARLLVTLTETGETSRLVCKYRPTVPVICITGNPVVARQLLVTRAAYPFYLPGREQYSNDGAIQVALATARRQGLVHVGDSIVAVLGDVEGIAGKTNCFKIVIVPEEPSLSTQSSHKV